MRNRSTGERVRLKAELDAIYRRMDAAYADKLDGRISEHFWQRKQADWQSEEGRLKEQISGRESEKTSDRLLNVPRILELAQKA